ncbi:MAG: TetR/AcrR family transcriptional regulator [Sphingomonas sp.]|nr:TetR/AcrR family transcriptional regulator [Sphingomonas sp.]RZV50368.1 MAG: TetR/AcrR family transcriptional regulator [Sphingomonadaceae bacterium]
MAEIAGKPAKSGSSKTPRTSRGEKTRARILDAARQEFGAKGFGESSIVGITQRAKVALGTFYTYFNSKEEVFAALVKDMSGQVRDHVAPALADADDTIDAERRALAAFLTFAREKKEVYRIIDEAEFVDPEGFEAHYRATAARIAERLESGDVEPAIDALDAEVRAWAIMGMNVFLGLRFSVWDDEEASKVAASANRLIADGLKPR